MVLRLILSFIFIWSENQSLRNRKQHPIRKVVALLDLIHSLFLKMLKNLVTTAQDEFMQSRWHVALFQTSL